MAPKPSTDRWRSLEPLLDAALDVAPDQRESFVASACGGDDELRADVMQLLAEFDVRDPLLDRPAAEHFASLLNDAATPLPAILGARYRIERELGRGGMATVYLAADLRHERQVAVKVLRRDIAAALGAQRFLTEIRLTAQLQHPHILPLHDSGNEAGILFYVMPFVDGESLRVRLERERQLSVADAVRIACEIASALDAAHRRGVIHRDIKPENILLHDGTALVADFGIALALSAASPRTTKPGLAIGTPQYMSPEQATGEGTIDARADVYALGTVLYEMLAGEPPFTGTSGTAIIAKRSAMPAPPLRVVRQSISPAIEAVVARALAREPVDRFASADEFAEAMKAALADRGAVDDTAGLPHTITSRRLGWWLAGSAVALLVIGGAAILARPSAGADPLNSIAVLPLADIGTDTTNAFFAAGMTEFLNGALGKLPTLRVTPSGSTGVPLNGKLPVDLKRLGQSLGVAMLLRGATLRANGQLQVSVYLVSSRTGRTIWSNTYRTALDQAANVFAMQDEIFADISRQLRVTTGAAPSAASSHARTDNLRALTLYWQGQALYDRRTPDGLGKAREYLSKSIEADSNFAQAHIALAEVYNTYAIGNLGDYRPSEYYPQARSHAVHALVLDPGAADAHAILGAVRLLFDFDWAGAEAELKQALSLNPRSANAHLWLGTLYGFTGRSDAGVTSALEGLSVDPRSLYANVEVGRALIFDRKYDLAAERFKQLIERDSNAVRSHLLLGQVFEQTGKYDSAVAEMQTAVRLAPRSSRALAYLAHAHALAGDTTDALHELGLLLDRSRSAYVPAFDFAVVSVGLGRIDETFDWLEKSLADHSLRPYFMDATFDPVRSDPRYKPFLKKLNLPLDTTTR